MGSLLSRLFGRDEYIGTTVYIHGIPYLFERRLGTGAFGTVFSARAPDRSPRAVKVIYLQGLPPPKKMRLVESYLNEVSLLERLRQESLHVVSIYDFDFDARSGRAYIVMELGGENLGQFIRRLRSEGRTDGNSIDLVTMKAFWQQMVSIVTTLHRNAVVHMDLKPDNLILFGSTLKIADLGASRKIDVVGQARMGTPLFSAPEVMQDIAGVQRFNDPQADIWSMGAILYFMAYGLPPRYQMFAASPPPGFYPHPDPLLNDVLRRTLVLNPAQRADIGALWHHPFTRF